MKSRSRCTSRLGGLLLAIAAGTTTASHAEMLFGLTANNEIFRFDSANPGNGSDPIPLTGFLAPNERALAIDLASPISSRSGERLWALSSASVLYNVDASGSVVGVDSLTPRAIGVPLVGSAFDIDFTPEPRQLGVFQDLRVVSTSGQQLLYDGFTTTVGTPLPPGIGGVAFSGPNLATAGPIYYLDSVSDVLKRASPAFNGPLTTVGSLGFDASNIGGFDISGITGIAYTAWTDPASGRSGLYTVNLATGAASRVGDFGIGGNTLNGPQVISLTVAAIPEPGTPVLWLLGMCALGLRAPNRGRPDPDVKACNRRRLQDAAVSSGRMQLSFSCGTKLVFR